MRTTWFFLLLTIACGPALQADTNYTYSGPQYTNCFGAYLNGGVCGGAYSLTGTLDLSLPLAQLEGLTGYIVPDADIVSISFADGVLAGLTKTSAVTDFVELSTNGAGDITSWAIYLSTQTPATGTTVQGETIATYSTPIATLNADVSGDQVQTICGPAATNPPAGCDFGVPSGGDDVNGGLTESAGTWSAPVATPEPDTWILLAVMLLLLARMRVRPV